MYAFSSARWTNPDAMNLQGTLELTSDPDFRDVIYTTAINPTSEQEDLACCILDAGTNTTGESNFQVILVN